jgi:hypothetical protein
MAHPMTEEERRKRREAINDELDQMDKQLQAGTMTNKEYMDRETRLWQEWQSL